MRPYTLISISLICLCMVGCKRGKKNDYTSETYYEQTYSRDWYTLCITKTAQYKPVVVAVPIEDRVEPAFVVSRVLYDREGETYKEVKVKTVNLEQYEAADQRRQKVLNNLFNAFRIMILVGGAGMFIGLLLFALKFKFPAIPSIWDEFLIYGGVILCIGMFGAWYVEQFITVCICGGAAIIVFAGYSLYKHTRMERRHLQTKGDLEMNNVALEEIVLSVEVLKTELGDRWESVRDRLEQRPETKALVDMIQEKSLQKTEA